MRVLFKWPWRISWFKGDSYIISLSSTDEVKMACNLGEDEVSSNYDQCKISFFSWIATLALRTRLEMQKRRLIFGICC